MFFVWRDINSQSPCINSYKLNQDSQALVDPLPKQRAASHWRRSWFAHGQPASGSLFHLVASTAPKKGQGSQIAKALDILGNDSYQVDTRIYAKNQHIFVVTLCIWQGMGINLDISQTVSPLLFPTLLLLRCTGCSTCQFSISFSFLNFLSVSSWQNWKPTRIMSHRDINATRIGCIHL